MKTILLFTVLLSIYSCSKSDETTETRKIINVRYGTSFGECMSYCTRNIEVTPGSISYTATSWNAEEQPISCMHEITNTAWDSIYPTIDIDTYFAMDSVYDCPDCADGGTEWIEIELDNRRSKKVIFEFGNTPTPLSATIATLKNTFIAERISCEGLQD